MPVNTEGKRKQAERIPSTIQFPYSDLSDAIAIAEGLRKGGGVALSRDQLAAAMGLAPGGGGFATKVATARTFGVLESVAGKYQLTEIGHDIVDPSRQAEAKIRAFMNVELFKRTYDEFRGKLLPPRPTGLDAAFINFGVTAKNVRHARLAFEKSARIAGLYPGGNEDRLVMPFGAPANAAPVEEEPADSKQAMVASLITGGPPRAYASSSQSANRGIHPSILGMVEELPPPKSDWSMADQADWLKALATMFRVIYKSDDFGSIEIKFHEQPPPVHRRHPTE